MNPEALASVLSTDDDPDEIIGMTTRSPEIVPNVTMTEPISTIDKVGGLPVDSGSVHLMSNGVRTRHGSTTTTPLNGVINPSYSGIDLGNTDIVEHSPDGYCGFGSCHPKSLQKFNNPKCLLVWLSITAFAQGMLVNGLINVVITTIERRYHLSSSESGLIASSYDISSLIFLLPVSYLGGAGYRNRWLAIGSAILGVGSLLFTLPHYLSDSYEDAMNITNVCVNNATQPTAITEECSSSMSRYKYVFIFAQFLHGAGAAPLYTLGVSFLDDSVKPKLSSLYVGIYYAFSMLGPACGFLLGGQFLTLYVDFDRLTSWTVRETSPAWVGAWWLGFLGTGIVALICSVPLFMFPAILPHSLEYRLQRKNETHADVVDPAATHTTFMANIHAFPKAVKSLMLNRTFVFINLAGAADAFLVMGLATYGPKVFQSLFGFSASMAAIIIGAITVPFGAGGTFLGGYLVKKLALNCANILRFCVICSFLALMCIFLFLIKCPNEKVAGVNVLYSNYSTAIYFQPELSSTCNQNCSCDAKLYDPVCSQDNIAYMTPCHAGCVEVQNTSTEFFHCSCIGISTDYSKPVARKTACSTNCAQMHWLFIVLFALLILFTFLSSIPAVSATLRCVADTQRPFAMGVQWIIIRLLGSVPGPLVFGALIDTVCTYWQPERCGTGKGRCLSYDNNGLSNAMFSIAIVGKSICTFFFFLAWWCYKPSESKSLTLTANPSDVRLTKYSTSVNVSTQSLDNDR